MKENYKKGDIIKGKVTGVTDYGIFVSFDDDYDGLIHISEMSYRFVNDVADYAKVGDAIFSQIIDVHDDNHLVLSIKDIDYTNGKKKKIMETETGFQTLSRMLPVWIEEKLQEINK